MAGNTISSNGKPIIIKHSAKFKPTTTNNSGNIVNKDKMKKPIAFGVFALIKLKSLVVVTSSLLFINFKNPIGKR